MDDIIGFDSAYRVWRPISAHDGTPEHRASVRAKKPGSPNPAVKWDQAAYARGILAQQVEDFFVAYADDSDGR